MANYFIVDGGGTTTRGWLVDQDGKVLAQAQAGPSNVARFGADGLRSALQELCDTCKGAASAERVVCGLAGVGRDRERGMAEEVAKIIWPAASVKIVTDAHLMYAGAFCNGEHGILLIIGTGSIAMYQNPHGHEFFRAGGWGPLWVTKAAARGLAAKPSGYVCAKASARSCRRSMRRFWKNLRSTPLKTLSRKSTAKTSDRHVGPSLRLWFSTLPTNNKKLWTFSSGRCWS